MKTIVELILRDIEDDISNNQRQATANPELGSIHHYARISGIIVACAYTQASIFDISLSATCARCAQVTTEGSISPGAKPGSPH